MDINKMKIGSSHARQVPIENFRSTKKFIRMWLQIRIMVFFLI